MSSNDDKRGGPVVTPSSPDQPGEMLSSRRLRIEEIKERRRRFHKETAERWILEQQFGVGGQGEDGGGGGSEKGADGVDFCGDRKSFLDAFEFFSKGCDDGGRRGSNDSCGGGESSSGRVAARRRLDGEREFDLFLIFFKYDNNVFTWGTQNYSNYLHNWVLKLYKRVSLS